jgi:hypothetical protein
MCTVSWVHQPGGYHLLCNRDEKNTRGRALGPQVVERGGVRYIAPADADSGGTWITVNEFGIAACLLNRTSGTVASRSRGLLLRDLAWASPSDECLVRLRQMDLRPFAGFTLLVLEPDAAAKVAEWDGSRLVVDPAGDAHMPLTSSSYDAAGVRSARLNEYARHAGPRVDAAALYRFHTSHGKAPDAYSPCMHRADAETVSFSWVTVSRSEVRFLYSPAAPCRCSASEQRVMDRAA